jgi:hypothetical protein
MPSIPRFYNDISTPIETEDDFEDHLSSSSASLQSLEADPPENERLRAPLQKHLPAARRRLPRRTSRNAR